MPVSSALPNLLNRYAEIGVSDILALRGRRSLADGSGNTGEFQHAGDLVDFVAADGRLTLLSPLFPRGAS